VEANHKDRKHALLSASGASRWLNCTPSARLEEKFEDSADSPYAAEGTLAHEFGELGLKKAMKLITLAQYNKKYKELQKSEHYSAEMDTEVEKYVTFCLEQFNVAKKDCPGAEMLIEEKVDLTEFIEDGFGTCDNNIIADIILEVTDLKYGRGVKVFADENEQLMLYGLGALRLYDLCYDIHTVKLTIFQPRLDHYSSWEISVEDLENWGETVVKPKAKLAYAGEGLQCAGDHCRWCKAKAKCGTLASHNTRLAKHEFQDPHLLTDDLLLKVYEQIGMLTDWANAVSTHILKEALAGKKWKGYKLVEGKSNRKWVDEEKIKEKLIDEGYKSDKILNTKLKGIGDIEKLVGKKEFPALLGEWVDKPQGKPTLVVESDKRPEFQNPENDFK
jgi:hypothetical protein